MMQFSHTVQALPPDADALAGTVNTDVIGLAKFRRVVFSVQIGVGATGTTNIKVQGCDDFTPSNTEDVAAKYRLADGDDEFGNWLDLPAAGYHTVAGSNQTIEIMVDAEMLPDDHPNVRLNCVEDDNDPVDAAITAVMLEPRYHGEPPLSAIA